MITNPEKLPDVYSCKKAVMEYLVFKCHLPLLSFDGDLYYFTNNDLLKKSLNEMPLILKIVSAF